MLMPRSSRDADAEQGEQGVRLDDACGFRWSGRALGLPATASG
jgi:hypothetical protein